MEFYEAIEKRRTIRDFENTTIPQDVLERIIGAALRAPTNEQIKQKEISVQERMHWDKW